MANGNGFKEELLKGILKGGPLAILLGLVLYWVMNIANAKMDLMIDLLRDLNSKMEVSNTLHQFQNSRTSRVP